MIRDYNKAVELLKETISRIRSLEPEDRSDYCVYSNGCAINLCLEEWLDRIDDSLFEDLDKLSNDVGAEIAAWASVDHKLVYDGINYEVDQNQTVVIFKATPDEIYDEVLLGVEGQMMNLNKKEHQRVMMEVEPEEAQYILERKDQIEKELNIENIEYWRMKGEGPEVVHMLFWDYKK